MKVVVLGGSGFVGRNVSDLLSETDIDFCTAGRSEGTDLCDVDATRLLFRREKPDIIVNCAAHVGSLNYVAKQAATVVVDNTRMILGMYEAVATECPSTIVINPIANCAYPATDNTFCEDHWWDGPLHRSVLSYGSTRRMLWAVAECFQMQHGVKSIHLFSPNMYGPYDSTDPNKAHALNALISKFVAAQINGLHEIEVWGSGIAIREWLFAADFGRVVQQIIEAPDMIGLSEPINVAQNFGLSVRELVDLIVAHVGFKGRITYDYTMPDGASRKVMDDQRFRKVFPNFEFTDLQCGIEKTIEYYTSILSDNRAAA